MKALLLSIAILFSLAASSQDLYYWQDKSTSSTSFDYMPPFPAVVSIIYVEDTTEWHNNVPNVYYRSLADSNVVETTPVYILTADADGKIQKVHKDSLHFAPASEGMQTMQRNPMTAFEAADFVIEKVEYFDLLGNEVTPAKSSDYYVKVTFTNGQSITQRYIEKE